MALIENLHQLSKIGRTTQGGVTRRAFSEEDIAGRNLVIQMMEEAGLEVRIDEDTNIIGTKRGQEDLPPIVTGSHIDTVPNGGIYDGPLGVLGGIEAIASIQTPRHPLEVVVFTDEESTMCGSKGMTKNRKEDIAAFLELHVEQGPVLERTGNNIGVVTGIVGQRRFEVAYGGEANHAGTTPMDMRLDALLKAAALITWVNRQALEFGNGLVATVGKINVTPNAANVIPNRAELTVEFRDLDPRALQDFEDQLEKYVWETGGMTNKIYESTPVPCDPVVMGAIEAASRVSLSKYLDMPSRASHDAQELGRRWPMGMIFVPSVRGISHNPAEYTSDEDCTRGVEVLRNAIARLDVTLD